MSIKEIDNGTLSLIPGKKAKREEVSGLDFQKLLQEAHSKSNQAGSTGYSSPTVEGSEIQAHPPFPTGSGSFIPAGGELFSSQSQGARAVENTLNLLEKYQKAIGDHGITLKEIEPLIQSLSREVIKLAQVSGQLSPSDPLQKILTEIQVLSSVEVERFNRGDYI